MINIDLNDHVVSVGLEDPSDPCCFLPIKLNAGEYTFIYTYPLTGYAKFNHELKDGISAHDIMMMGRLDYLQIYKEEKETSSVEEKLIDGMFNRVETNGKHGIWGHVIEDLYFEGINIHEGNRTVTFSMGS